MVAGEACCCDGDVTEEDVHDDEEGNDCWELVASGCSPRLPPSSPFWNTFFAFLLEGDKPTLLTLEIEFFDLLVVELPLAMEAEATVEMDGEEDETSCASATIPLRGLAATGLSRWSSPSSSSSKSHSSFIVDKVYLYTYYKTFEFDVI